MTEHTTDETPEESPTTDPSSLEDESGAPSESSPNVVVRGWRALRSRWWSRLLSEAALLLVVFWAIMAFQTRHLIDDGALAPDITLSDLTGETHSLSDYRGKKVLLAFWAPWCTVCGYEASNWQSIAEDMDVVVLSVALSYESEQDVHDFVAEHGLEVPVLLGSPNVAESYAVDTFPTMYVLDEAGRVEHALVGYTTTVGLKTRLAF